ncbi:MAG: thiamine biosynthesis protein ThiF [Coxiellaceae bacterium]|nr:thiamine biosynthesis protein ThiF [Coxiellaceae bacterium]|tara:strand:+ start:15288 stop:16388 length:1101 start_codon:yes stop_codon:yes gene_type:complete
MVELSQEDILRYSRQLPIIGLDGQKQLKASSVLCIGAGGLGCVVLQYLVAAGIGCIHIADGDQVELSNLQRQVLFTESDIGKSKSQTTVDRLQALNTTVELHALEHFINDTTRHLMPVCDVIVDASDNLSTRYWLNRYCRELAIPLVSASVYQTQGQLSVFNYHQGPCYECLYPTPPPASLVPSCAMAGVVGVVPGLFGVMQANEVMKVLLNKPNVLSGKLLTVNTESMAFNIFTIEKQFNCTKHGCADSVIKELSRDTSASCPTVDCRTVQQWQQSEQSFYWLDVREPYERDIVSIESDHVPLLLLSDQLSKLDQHQSWVVFCKSGQRSQQAVQQMLEAGFTKVWSLQGGLMAWVDEIEPNLLRY